MNDPIDPFLCFAGLMIWPSVTCGITIGLYGHPVLGVVAFLSIEYSKKVRKIVKEKIVDRHGNVIRKTKVETTED